MKNTVSQSNFDITKNTRSQTHCLWGFKRSVNPMLVKAIERFSRQNPLRPVIKIGNGFLFEILSPIRFETSTDISKRIFHRFGEKVKRIFSEKSFTVSNLFHNTFLKTNPVRVQRNFSTYSFQKFFREFLSNLSTDFILKIRFGFGENPQRIFPRKSFANSGKLSNGFIFRNSLSLQILSATDFISEFFQSFGRNQQRIYFQKSVEVSGKILNGFYLKNLSPFQTLPATDFFLRFFRQLAEKIKRILVEKSFDCFEQHSFICLSEASIYGRLRGGVFECCRN